MKLIWIDLIAQRHKGMMNHGMMNEAIMKRVTMNEAIMNRVTMNEAIMNRVTVKWTKMNQTTLNKNQVMMPHLIVKVRTCKIWINIILCSGLFLWV